MNHMPAEKIEPSYSKRILCVDIDCFSAIGGGQTAYSNLARHYPEYCFYYPTQLNDASPCYPNTVSVRYKMAGDVADFGKLAREHSRFHIYDFADYASAINMAHTFRGMDFDIVDVPDYNSYGRFLRAAFDREGIRVGRYVQSLHGRVSVTYLYEWFKIGQKPNAYDYARRRAEDLSLSSMDVRYGLSGTYIETLRNLAPFRYYQIDPLLCVSIPKAELLPTIPHGERARPVFIGRLERQKGADLFVHLLWDLGSASMKRGLIIGAETQLGGVSSRGKLFEYLQSRGIEAEYLEKMSSSELKREVFSKASVLVLPSRQDTFNLVALEAVLHGCPVLIGNRAGASSWLSRRFPDAAIRIFYENEWEKGADDLHELLENFGEFRSITLNALINNPPVPDPTGLTLAYNAEPDYSQEARRLCRREFESIGRFLSLMLYGASNKTEAVHREVPAAVTPPSLIRKLDDPEGLHRFLAAALKTEDEPEDSPDALEIKRQKLKGLIKNSPYYLRSYLFEELAEIEDKLGNTLVAAAYRIRLIRWVNSDRLDFLQSLCVTLKNAGMNEEAKTVELLTNAAGNRGDGSEIYNYLKQRYDSLRAVRLDDSWNVIYQRHRREGYRASVIVSNYNTSAEHFLRFLKLLKRNTMIRRGEAEIVVIDSGSPKQQWELNASDVRDADIDITFVRTINRESIQQAWNRGIFLSKGEYLTFLGTDESIRRDALDVLSDCLDNNPTVDWAMGDSFISSVDSDGSLILDKMAYLRKGLNHTSMTFDCTYLGYVGGLYRRSVHERFGYYDASFRGAGDTEFKCRIFPQLRVKHVPETLGQFLDYPTERTTNSARVEIEDSRAWYIFRTLGGIRYLYKDASQDILEAAFWGALANRRAYVKHSESDVSFAYSILRYIAEKYPDSKAIMMIQPLREMHQTLADIGCQSDWSKNGEREFIRRVHASEIYFRWFQSLHNDLTFPSDLTTDARFFAHSWLWD
jgi:glycosyltransferase involved in cell wall biosynthesis